MHANSIKDSRLADRQLKQLHLASKVQDLPGASINAGNVELDLSKFGPEASVALAEFGTEVATVTVASEIATLDFTSAVSASDVIKVWVDLKLGE